MLRLPPFTYEAPGDLAEAVAIKAEHGERASYCSGGTDLLPNMKRRQQEPEVVIDVRRLPELSGISVEEGARLRVGAGVTLSEVAADARIRERWSALAQAAGEVATPLLRNMGTLGGNICLDTRCSYYTQSYSWRKAVGFCMKKDGEICLVAPSSPKCWAVQSSDTAPTLIALGAKIELVGPKGRRVIDAGAMYRNDGMAFLTKAPDELVVAVWLDPVEGARSSYVKVARRGAFDFPVLGVGAWVRRDSATGPVTEARLVLGAVAPAPIVVDAAAEALVGKPLSDETIATAAEAAWKQARPLENADLVAGWRKKVVRPYVTRALQQLAD